MLLKMAVSFLIFKALRTQEKKSNEKMIKQENRQGIGAGANHCEER